MLVHLIAAASLAATYTAEGTLEPIQVTVGSDTQRCYPLKPGATLRLEGPAEAKLFVWVDLPKRPRKPRPVQVRTEVAGKTVKRRLKPRRARHSGYAAAAGLEPSRRLKAATFAVPDGRHLLTVALPANRSGCMSLAGLELREPTGPDPLTDAQRPQASEPEPALGASVAEPALEAAPSLAAAAGATAAEPSETDAANLKPSDSLGVVPLPGTTVAAVHEIAAAEVAQAPTVEATKTIDAPPQTQVGDLLRVGPKVGGFLPRADLKPGVSLSLLVDVPLRTLGVPASFGMGAFAADLSVYVEGGWSPMRQQQTASIPGRGQTDLIQSSLVLPFDLGLRLRLELGALAPFVGLAFAADYSRTELRSFSTEPVQHNDLGFGVAAAGGLAIRLGPGDLMLEFRYRETHADLGSYDTVGEGTLANAALHLGYVVAVSR